MTEYELDKIKKSFVRSNAKCPVEVACLLTVIKYYNGKETDMQYWADEMKTLWIKGIALTLFPTQDFMNSANLHLKWWEIYSWSKLWKRKVEHWYEYIWLNVPLFRQMVYKLGKNK